MSIFSGRHYPKDVILWAVRWYCRYGVSDRDLEEMLTERGAAVDHTTIYRWVQKYGPELDKRIRWYRQTSPWFADSWRVDETYIRVGGKWCYLYRAVTKDGRTLDFYMSTRCNTQAATKFLGEALCGAGRRGPDSGSRVVCTDKAPTYTAAIAALIDKEKRSTRVEHRQVKYLNNVIEGDHGRLKRILGPKGGGFKTPVSAYRGATRNGGDARAV
jgi:IS6 family transposase